MKSGLYWIPGPWRGRLAILPRPRGGDWLADETADWRRAGLSLVVSLLEESEAREFDLDRESELAESQGLQFISFPIPDRGVPASTGSALSLLTKLSAALDSGKNVAIHCRQGIGRSGLIAAGLLIAAKVDVPKAIETVSLARCHNIPETPAQLQWLQQLATETAAPTT